MKPKLVSTIGILALAAAPGILLAQSTTDSQSPATEYLGRVFSPGSVVKSAAAAGIDQAGANPPEWGGGAEGFGLRFGSAFGTHFVRSTIHFGVGKLLHEELSYRPSGKTGFGSRLKYALLSTVLTHKTTNQHRTMAVGEISGIVGGGFISRLWHPDAYQTVSSGFAATGVGFAGEAGMNVLREFWPEIRHPHRHHGQTESASPAAIPGPSATPLIPTSNGGQP